MTPQTAYAIIVSIQITFMTLIGLYAVLWYFKVKARKNILKPLCWQEYFFISSISLLFESILNDGTYFPYCTLVVQGIYFGVTLCLYIYTALYLLRKKIPE